ncbi:MAG: glycosyltransferase family 9 protein [Endomicrobium sp.]|jgi:ADP-heptose:LPS heptosyltransferase|nr:glycosyltransferase family 9 protein [Endomicrobium sp.]
MDKIVFFHMNQLGDLLFSLPVLKAAENELNAEIYSVVKPGLAPLLTSSGIVNGTISKDLPFFELIKDLKSKKFDKAVLFSESPSSVLSAYFSGIKERAGFGTSSLNFLLTKKSKRTGVPSLFNNKTLASDAGLKNVGQDYTGILKIPDGNVSNAEKWFKENSLNPSKTVAVSAGASKKRANKRLPAEKWAAVMDALSEKGVSCVLTGAVWERDSLFEISKRCKSDPKIFTPENGILDLAAFFKLSRLFMGIDSGPMHLAAAAGAKCLAVFGPTDPSQIGPMPPGKHIILKKDDISLISPEDIIVKAAQIL